MYREIRLAALTTDPQAFGAYLAATAERPEAYWRERLEEAQAEESGWLLFASDGERLAGMIGAHLTPEPEVVEIVAVYVRPEARGQGIGALLMEGILAAVGSSGRFRKAVLGVNSAQSAAVGLYRRFGFELAREETYVREDGEVRLSYFMERELP